MGFIVAVAGILALTAQMVDWFEDFGRQGVAISWFARQEMRLVPAPRAWTVYLYRYSAPIKEALGAYNVATKDNRYLIEIAAT